MRVLCGTIIFLAGLGAFAQESPVSAPGENLFTTQKPDAWIVIRSHTTGSDVVEVSMQAPGYSIATLQKQVNSLAAYLPKAPWGLAVTPYAPDAKSMPGVVFARATFAATGLIDTQTGAFRLEPLARMLTGAEGKNEVHVISVVYESLRPGANTLQNFSSSSVQVQGVSDQSQIGLEYRIKLLTQDPSKITIPELATETAKKPPPVAPTQGVDWLLWTLIVVAALALSALVYSLLVRGSPQPRAK